MNNAQRTLKLDMATLVNTLLVEQKKLVIAKILTDQKLNKKKKDWNVALHHNTRNFNYTELDFYKLLRDELRLDLKRVFQEVDADLIAQHFPSRGTKKKSGWFRATGWMFISRSGVVEALCKLVEDSGVQLVENMSPLSFASKLMDAFWKCDDKFREQINSLVATLNESQFRVSEEDVALIRSHPRYNEGYKGRTADGWRLDLWRYDENESAYEHEEWLADQRVVEWERIEREFEEAADPAFGELVGEDVDDDGCVHRVYEDYCGAYEVLSMAIEDWIKRASCYLDVFSDKKPQVRTRGFSRFVWDFIANGPQRAQQLRSLKRKLRDGASIHLNLDCATGITACFYRGQNFN